MARVKHGGAKQPGLLPKSKSKPLQTVPLSQYRTVLVLQQSNHEELKVVRQKLLDAEAQILSLQSKSLAHTSMVKILEGKLDQQEKQLTAYEGQQAQLQQELASAVTRANSAQAHARETEMSYEKQRHQLEASEQQARSLQSQLTALQLSLQCAKAEYAQEKKKNQTLSQELKQLQQDSEASFHSFNAAAACANKALDRSSRQNVADAALLEIMTSEVTQIKANLHTANLTISALRQNVDPVAVDHRYPMRHARALLRTAVLRWCIRKQRNLISHPTSCSTTGNATIAHYDAMMARAWHALEEKDRFIARLQQSFDNAIEDMNNDLTPP